MPRQLLFSRFPVETSIVEFNLDEGEEIFLTYTWDRREGPEICRTGMGPPSMSLIGGPPGQRTTHPFGLRLGTWLIAEEMRKDELEEAKKELINARARGAPAEDLWVLERTVKELETIRAHDQLFQSLRPDFEIIGHQGCGDLTMNAWNVAFVNGPLGQDASSGEKPPQLVFLPKEPVDERVYSCLVKWKSSEGRAGALTIEEVKFRRRGHVTESNEMVWVRFREGSLPRGDAIEFAVSNQQVIREGEIVPAVTTCRQFGDLRHLIQMPNMNPNRPLFPSEGPKGNGGYLPRHYFKGLQEGDIWFGEAEFLNEQKSEEERENLVRASLTVPLFIQFPEGADRQRIEGAMALAGYRQILRPLVPLQPGDWRFNGPPTKATSVEVFFKRNTYAWTMIGLGPDHRRIFALACGGFPGKTGYTLEEAADLLRQAGAWNALLIDEGADVFQRVRWDGGPLIDLVPRLRRRLRSTFIFARCGARRQMRDASPAAALS
jgi:hypothetical protein